MHYFTFADKDSTLYEVSSSMNSGLDEILEVRKDVSDTGAFVNSSRILIKFDLTTISESISAGLIPDSGSKAARYFLNLYDARPTALATSQSLYAYPVSQSWTMGDARSYDDPIVEEGCSWYYRDGETDGTLWGPTYSGSNTVSSSGGSWISGSGYEGKVNFTHKSSDFRMDVTDITKKWLNGAKPRKIIVVPGKLVNIVI